MSTNKITPKNILNHGKNKNKITLDNLLEKATTDNVSDAVKKVCGKNGVIKGVKPIDEKFKIVGKIRTAHTNSSDWGTGIKAIYECEKDEILLIDCSDDETAIWGELASQAAQEYGLQATVINGASRDTEGIRNLGYPVFSKLTMPNAGYALNNGVINERLNINGNIIVTGDYLVGDSEGVVVIPKERIDEILAEVANIKKFEESIMSQMSDANNHMDEILNIK
ncbi:MAG: RraA family protein [Methanosphaera sp.]|nr:RraA family protein [Methanosphaera sp.]